MTGYLKNKTVENKEEYSAGAVLDERFEIQDFVSRSGMAYFQGPRPENRAIVAIKCPSCNSRVIRRFHPLQREEEIGQTLNHPYILKFFPVENQRAGPTLSWNFCKATHWPTC